MTNLGQTRSALRHDHLLQTPDTFVRAPLPGMQRATAIVHASPQIGANFAQYTAELQPDGTLGCTRHQRLLYVLEGEIRLSAEREAHLLVPGGYAYLPSGVAHDVAATTDSILAVIEKPDVRIPDNPVPSCLIGREHEISAQALGGDESLAVRSLLPDDPAFDFAVNTMTYLPGASLPVVEIHVMQHGLLMLEGGGIYRLGDCWYPVQAGDFIWMAPFCPQWFGALGKTPAKYLIYKDWNRHPLA